MSDEIVNRIMGKLKQVDDLYNRLLLVVGPSGSGKTKILQKVAKSFEIFPININLEISNLMLELTVRQRKLKLPKLLQNMIRKIEQNIVVLDNIEILFDVNFQQDPMRLLQGLSRHKTIVAGWNGSIKKGYLTYAVSEHPEYRKYSVKDFLVVDIQAAS